MHIPEAFWMPFLPWEVRDMSESKEVILEAKHVTRRFRTTDGQKLPELDADFEAKRKAGHCLPTTMSI